MKLNICEFPSRKSNGKNNALSWEQFAKKLSAPAVTHESSADFHKFDKDRQSEIKDVGGFIAGYVKEGRRVKGNIESRSMVVLDADYAGEDFAEKVESEFAGYSYVFYPTHKSRKGERKYRLIFPLSRDVSAEEYEPIARWITSRIGMNRFDPTTYQPERLMFYPSISSDSEYDFKNSEGIFADPDLILSTYHDWHDISEWPVSDLENQTVARKIERGIKKQDPLEKTGIIGAFCRTYSMSEAINEFLSDVYSPTRSPDRYTYIDGHTSSGLVIYSDKFAYSHHSTDPACSELMNVFDLVRVHKFGHLDENSNGKFGDSLPSFRAMKEFCTTLPEVKKELVASKVEAYDDFKDELELSDSWTDKLDMNVKTGEILATAKNIKLILENDQAFKNKLAKDLMSGRPVKLGLMPWDIEGHSLTNNWKDEDDASMRNYLEEKYGIHSKEKTADALTEVLAAHAFHPVRDYLESLEWDGVERLDTILIDYLGADDSKYTRAVTRKAFTACVARIFEPGIKFDYMLLMVGSQGRGKSNFLKQMGGQWFSDTITNVGSKESYEALDGTWIVEMAEMTAAKKADIEALKQFISKQSDKYRKAYDRRVTENPRQCVFFGTTNEYECLRDYTGNRRFWVLDVHDNKGSKDQFTQLADERDQIWAEAVVRYKNHEPLFLSKELEKLAQAVQDAHTFRSTRWADIRDYLNRMIPLDWYDMDPLDRLEWLVNNPEDAGDMKRFKVCAKEVWYECCGGNGKNFSPVDQRDICACLDFLGWQRTKNNIRIKGYGAQKGFTRPNDDDDA